MSFQKSRRRQNRDFWRRVFIAVIGLTVPCYILAFFAYAFASPEVKGRFPTEVIPATWTPIDPYPLLTQTALANPAATITVIVPSNTPFDNFTAAPNFFTPDVFVSSTPVPTRFITLTPSVTPQATNTVPPTIAQPTVAPTDAPPILIPPTDTPNP